MRAFTRFRLSFLFAVTFFVGLLLAAWRIYVSTFLEEAEAIEAIRNQGAVVVTEPTPNWLVEHTIGEEYLAHAVFVDARNCERPSEVVASLAACRELQDLAVGGLGFGEQEFESVAHLESLRFVLLDTTNVSDQALSERLPFVVVRSDKLAISKLREIEISAWGDVVPLPVNVRLLESDAIQRVTSAQVVDPRADFEPNGLYFSYAATVARAEFDDEGMRQLAQIGRYNLKSMETLILERSLITDTSLPAFKPLSALTQLDVAKTDLTDDGVKKLQATLPNCLIRHSFVSDTRLLGNDRRR